MEHKFSAMLHISGSAYAAVDFYQRAFDAKLVWNTPPADDMVAQLSAHGAEFWIHPANSKYDNLSPHDLGGTAVRLMLIVDDPDAVFEHAIAAGATVRTPMEDHDYGWRDGTLIDPFGHRWEVCKPL